MPLPGGATGFTLTGGPYDDPAFQGMAGKLTLSTPVTHIATGERVRKTWDFSIDYSGNFSIGPLPFTDDPAFSPTGFTYTVEWQAIAWKDTPGNLTFSVPTGTAVAGVVDFDKLVPATAGGISYPATVTSVNGKQGVVVLSAADVGAAPAGSSGAVASVNGKTGTVVLAASDVGADAAGAATAAQAAALAGSTPVQRVAATVTTASTLAVNKHNPVDATAGPLTTTLPTGQIEGAQIVVEKTDTTTNAVTVSGSLRGVGAQTVVLVWQRETVMLRADSSGSWWPIAGHKTKSSLDAAYAGQVTDAAVATQVTTGTTTTAALRGAYVALGQLAASPDLMAVGAITRSSTGAATGFGVVWPDGATGTYAGTESTSAPGAIDSYTVTHVANGTTATYTQPALTRDSSGNVTARPAMTVA